MSKLLVINPNFPESEVKNLLTIFGERFTLCFSELLSQNKAVIFNKSRVVVYTPPSSFKKFKLKLPDDVRRKLEDEYLGNIEYLDVEDVNKIILSDCELLEEVRLEK